MGNQYSQVSGEDSERVSEERRKEIFNYTYSLVKSMVKNLAPDEVVCSGTKIVGRGTSVNNIAMYKVTREDGIEDTLFTFYTNKKEHVYSLKDLGIKPRVTQSDYEQKLFCFYISDMLVKGRVRKDLQAEAQYEIEEGVETHPWNKL